MHSETDFDVVILGGGLAGATLARQLTRQNPDIRLAVIERHSGPAPEAAWKIGESTVEGFSHYLANVLGLADHIRKEHLPKLGIRCFFDSPNKRDITKRLELGSNMFFPHSTYQVDRGRLENYLAEECKNHPSLDWIDGARVRDVTLGENGAAHTVFFDRDDEAHTCNARWIVDASGRNALLRRKLDLEEPCSHAINSSWFRINHKIDINSWSEDPNWSTNNQGALSRWFSTNHLLGKGYWTWIIPLASGATSIGIVADPRHHSLEEFNTFERSLEWLTRHEPRLAEAIAPHCDALMDFSAVKHFSRRSKQVFSPDRWGLTGDAGIFVDPLYSPGGDFIAFANTFLTDLISRDLAGERFRGQAQLFDNLFITYADNSFLLYENQYQLFGAPQVMSVKIVWDFATYWVFFVFLFAHNRLCDAPLVSELLDEFKLIGRLNEAVQRAFNTHALDLSDNEIQGFIDLADVSFLYELNDLLVKPIAHDDVPVVFRDNVKKLESLANQIINYLQKKEMVTKRTDASDDSWDISPLLRQLENKQNAFYSQSPEEHHAA